MKVLAVSLLVLFVSVAYIFQPLETVLVIKLLVSAVFLFVAALLYLGWSISKCFFLVFMAPFLVNVDYNGKVFLILGASSGIGKDLALNAAQRGATVVLAARRLEKLESVAEECRREHGGGKVSVLQVDVTVSSDTQKAIDYVNSTFGRLDMLVLNAAVPGPWSHIEDIQNPTPLLHEVMNTNYWGYVTPTIQSLPLLKHSKGTIMVVSSVYGLVIAPFQAGYCASKHALHGFYDVLREELRPHGVEVKIHCPGGILTEVLSKFKSSKDEPIEMKLPDFFMGGSDECAKDILKLYDSSEREGYYPAYVGAFSLVRNVFPEFFDRAFHALTHFYIEIGVLNFT